MSDAGDLAQAIGELLTANGRALTTSEIELIATVARDLFESTASIGELAAFIVARMVDDDGLHSVASELRLTFACSRGEATALAELVRRFSPFIDEIIGLLRSQFDLSLAAYFSPP